jgi:PAS domain-containing protein
MNKLRHLGHKAEADFFKRIADDSPDMLYRMSLREGKYEYVSPAAIDIFGEPPEKWYSSMMK